jgi:hypothetical protein
MKHTLVSIILLFLISCAGKQKSDSPEDFNDKLLDFVIENSNDEYVELPGLYHGTTETIAEDNDEKLILVERLKARGFKVTNWGRGNYPPLGPRIFSLTLVNGDCECEVDKIYYSSVIKSVYMMSERIKCKKTGR